LQRDEMAVLRTADGKIAEARKFYDAAGMSCADLFETKNA
jgi:ketosteroid isomerase-like protein